MHRHCLRQECRTEATDAIGHSRGIRAKRGEIMSYQPVPALGKDWLTPFYDVLIAMLGWGPQLTENMLERADILDGERVLDVGCATATLLIAAKARYPTAHLVGVDPDERALQIARKKIARQRVEVEVVHARAENLPFQPSSFDLVMSS